MRHSTTIYLGGATKPVPEISGTVNSSAYAHLVLSVPGEPLDEIRFQFRTDDVNGRAVLLRLRDEINALVALVELDDEEDAYDLQLDPEVREIAIVDELHRLSREETR